jgi:hypothetical protein
MFKARLGKIGEFVVAECFDGRLCLLDHNPLSNFIAPWPRSTLSKKGI